MSAGRLLLTVAALLGMTATVAAGAPRPAASNLVMSERSPALTLRIARPFRALSSLRFPIENLTDVDRRIFVDADSRGRLRRMVVIQFERVQPGSDFRFLYPATPPRRFGAATYRSGAFVYDDRAAAAGAPLREAARTRAHLAANHLSPPRLWRTARLARVTDPDGLSEIILFYMENADRDFGPGALPGADSDGDLSLTGPARETMLGRLAAAIAAVRG